MMLGEDGMWRIDGNVMAPTNFQFCAAPLLLCALTSSAPAFENGPIDARVTDAVSHEPVAGAIVVANWERGHSSIAAGWTSCDHMQVAITDTQGRYHIDRWSHFDNPFDWFFSGKFVLVVMSYRAGMIYSVPPVVEFDERNGNIQMVKFAGSQPEHMNYLLHVAAWYCGYTGDDAKALRSLRQAVYAEAQEIATNSAQDQKILAGIWSQIQQGERRIVTAPESPPGGAPTPKTNPGPVGPSQSSPQTLKVQPR